MSRLIMIILLASAVWWVTANFNFAETNTVMVDPRLRPYVKEWCWEMEKAGLPWESRIRELKSIRVETYSVDSRETGNYWVYAKKITINSRFIKGDPCLLRATVFHELGHACFGLEHESCAIMQGRLLIDSKRYCDEWNLFLKEYLVQCKKRL